MNTHTFTLAIRTALLVSCVSPVTAAPSDEAAPPVHCLNKLHTLAEGGITNTYAYDSDGRVLSITGSDSRTTTFVWNLNTAPRTVTRSNFLGDQLIEATTFTLGKHDLAEASDAGINYQYDAHLFLLRQESANFVETRTIQDGNIVQVIRTGDDAFTITSAYTAIENCLDAGLHNFGKSTRNWPATTISIRATQPPVYITYRYQFDDLGRVVIQTETITVNSATSERTRYYTYE